MVEYLRDFLDLTRTLIRTIINCRTDSNSTHVEGLFNVSKQDLIKFVGIGEQLIVVNL